MTGVQSKGCRFSQNTNPPFEQKSWFIAQLVKVFNPLSISHVRRCSCKNYKKKKNLLFPRIRKKKGKHLNINWQWVPLDVCDKIFWLIFCFWQKGWRTKRKITGEKVQKADGVGILVVFFSFFFSVDFREKGNKKKLKFYRRTIQSGKVNRQGFLSLEFGKKRNSFSVGYLKFNVVLDYIKFFSFPLLFPPPFSLGTTADRMLSVLPFFLFYFFQKNIILEKNFQSSDPKL